MLTTDSAAFWRIVLQKHTWLLVSNSAFEMASSMVSSATRRATVSVSAMLCSEQWSLYSLPEWSLKNTVHPFIICKAELANRNLFSLTVLQPHVTKLSYRLKTWPSGRCSFSSCLQPLILLVQWLGRERRAQGTVGKVLSNSIWSMAAGNKHTFMDSWED